MLALCAAPFARATERPTVKDVRVYALGGVVRGEIRCAHLFSERVAGTVESGLPAVVELLYRLQTADGELRRRGLYAYEIVYDVWDDVYSVDRGDSVLTFASFNAMGRLLENLRGVSIVPLDELDDDVTNVVEFAVAVHPLRGGEREEIVGWVDEEVLGQSGRGWRGRMLNVGDLIHSLFSREKEEAFRSDWFRSASFTPPSLRRESSIRGGVRSPLAMAGRIRLGRDLPGGRR